MNVLITSAGRRTSLVRLFKSALEALGGKVVAGDMDGLAPALYEADTGVRLPPVSHASYAGAVLEVAIANGVGLVIPTVDPELPVFSADRDMFTSAGVRLMVSDLSLVEATGDKLSAFAFFSQKGISTPLTWLPGSPPDPIPERLFVKPRWGSASKDCYATDSEGLARVLELVPDPIVQEEVSGREITVDALLNFEGIPIHFVPRIRLKTLGGESIQGVTIRPSGDLMGWLEGVVLSMGAAGAIGVITLQAFLSPSGPTLTEVNLRFGGGVPLAFAAGGSYAAWLIEMTMDRPVSPRIGDFQSDVYMTRSMVEVFTRNPLWQ